MSKIGKLPVILPEGMSAKIEDGNLELKYKDRSLALKIIDHLKGEVVDGKITFSVSSNAKQAAANWGTMRALVRNAVSGMVGDFSKTLEINGVGFRAEVSGNDLILNIGFSHPVKLAIPPDVKITVEKNLIKVFGSDKALVGETAAKIRSFKKPEPYKGKGIKYQDEIIKRKAGKKVAGAAA